jgi:hypothetical protein
MRNLVLTAKNVQGDQEIRRICARRTLAYLSPHINLHTT